MANIEALENKIFQYPGAFDRKGVHHEFADGMHGQKVDIDAIKDKDPLFSELVRTTINFVHSRYGLSHYPAALVGTANGANRFAIATALGIPNMGGLKSEKDKLDAKKVHLTPIARSIMATLGRELVVVIDDIGTKGSMSVQVAREAKAAGAGEVEVLYLMQRRPRLEYLDEAGIAYSAIMHCYLDTFTAEECQTNPNGFCAQGWDLVEHGK